MEVNDFFTDPLFRLAEEVSSRFRARNREEKLQFGLLRVAEGNRPLTVPELQVLTELVRERRATTAELAHVLQRTEAETRNHLVRMVERRWVEARGEGKGPDMASLRCRVPRSGSLRRLRPGPWLRAASAGGR